MPSMTMDPWAWENDQNHLPSADNLCPKSQKTSTNHLKTRTSAPFTGSCRCLFLQKETVSCSCLDEEVVRDTREKKPSSAHRAVANGTGDGLPWYLTVIHEKEQCLLKLNKEVARLSDFEWQCSRKDHEILVLKGKLMEATGQLRVPCDDEVVKAQCPDAEPENFGDVVSLAEHKREQDEWEMTKRTLIQELEDTKNNHMISTGTVCSLRRTLSVRDGELATARAQVEEIKEELRDRMAQLQAMSRKFSCLREGKANEELIAALETENYALRQLTAQLKEEVSQKGQAAARFSGDLQHLQEVLLKGRALQAKLEKQGQENQDVITSLQLQHSKAKVSLEQIQTRFERLRVKIIQAAYSAPGARAPQTEISDAALLHTMQKIIDDRTTFHQRLQQKGEKMPPLTTAETNNLKTASASASAKN